MNGYPILGRALPIFIKAAEVAGCIFDADKNEVFDFHISDEEIGGEGALSGKGYLESYILGDG